MIKVSIKQSNKLIEVIYYHEQAKNPLLNLIIKPNEVHISLWCKALTWRDILKLEALLKNQLSENNVQNSTIGVVIEKPLSKEQVQKVINIVSEYLNELVNKPVKQKRIAKC